MAITDAQKQAIFAALDRAAADTIDADEMTRQQAAQRALVEAAGNLRVTEVTPVLREYARRLKLRQRDDGRVVRAMDAVMVEVQRAGVSTPGELLARRGHASLPELLAVLGFTGDLNALAAEMSAAVNRAA
jgi:hypothetical protein